RLRGDVERGHGHGRRVPRRARADLARHPGRSPRPVNRNIKLLYGFSCFDQFMIVIALWVPYLATKGIGMRQFMELQAVFALVILGGAFRVVLISSACG